MTVPFTDPVTDSSPVTVSGHVSLARARVIQLVYPDHAADEVPISPARFYVAEVPERHLAAVHRHGLLLIARDADGEALAQAVVPTDAISPPTEAERPKDPIEIDTISDGSDLTRMLGVRGTVQIPGRHATPAPLPRRPLRRDPAEGARLPLRRPAGARGRLRDARPARSRPSTPRGAKLGERKVASVAYWHRRNGG